MKDPMRIRCRIQYLIVVCLFVVAIYAATHALIYKKDSRAAFGWIAVCIFLPLFGPLSLFYIWNKSSA